jgi:outer membrane protein
MFSTWAARAGLFSLVFATAGIASAQLKIGVVDMRRAILESAEITKASKELADKYKPRQEQGQQLQKQLADIQQQLQTGGDKLSPAQQQELQLQGQRRQRELQRLSDDLQADLDRDRNEVLGKAQVNMKAIVDKLAADKGLDLVIDAGNAVSYKPALDFTQDAITAYNAAHPVK